MATNDLDKAAREELRAKLPHALRLTVKADTLAALLSMADDRDRLRDELAAERARAEKAEAQRDHLKDREATLIDTLKPADAGMYREDIVTRIKMLMERTEKAEAERDALRRHYDAASPEHNLLALLDLYHEEKTRAETDLAAANEVCAKMAEALRKIAASQIGPLCTFCDAFCPPAEHMETCRVGIAQRALAALAAVQDEGGRKGGESTHGS